MSEQNTGASASQNIDIDITAAARAAKWMLRGYQLVIFVGTPLFLITVLMTLWGALRDDPSAPFSVLIFAVIVVPAWYFKGRYSARSWLVFALISFLFLLLDFVGMIAFAADEKAFEIEGLAVFFGVFFVMSAAFWAGFYLYRYRVPGYGIKFRHLMNAVNQFRRKLRGDFVLPPPRNPIRAYTLLGIGGIVCLACLAAAPVIGALSVIGFPVATWFIVRGRQHLKPDAATLLEADKRAPVLLLRSFEDDPTEVSPKNLITYFQRNDYTLEEALEPELAGYGPFIAIGAPEEQLPRLGAARSYFTSETWQEAIEEWINHARMIVLVAGRTQWVEWEIKTIIENHCLGKLLIVLPPEKGEARRMRWDRLCDHFSETPWFSVLQSVDPEKILALHMWPNETLTIIRSRKSHQVDYELAVRLCVFGMTGLNAGQEGASRNKAS